MLQRIEKSEKSERDIQAEGDSLDLILNPHVYAVEDTLKAIYASNSDEIKNDLVDELTVVFTKDDILHNKKIQAKFPELLNLLKDGGVYNHACVLLSDMVRHKPFMQETFCLLKIFDFLNFKSYKSTMSLIFSMCYGNKKLTEMFFKDIYVKERDDNNELVQILREQE